MEERPTLVIMAAGMGSRFGGLKQVMPVGPCGETLVEYAIYDAMKAGFGHVVFVIKHAFAEQFRTQIGDRVSKKIPVSYVYQELTDLPDGFTVPAGREKPWGTGHAVMCCADTVKTPFAVINADDYYGRECFEQLARFFAQPQQSGKLHAAMVGYVLENTLTENGYVSRGICTTGTDGLLTDVVERTHIEWRDGVPMFTEDDGASWTALPDGTEVSMNCWGFPKEMLSCFASEFEQFLRELPADDKRLKKEFYLPFAVRSLMAQQHADVTMLHTPDKWYGMTYKADQEAVVAAIRRMTIGGFYPTDLWA